MGGDAAVIEVDTLTGDAIQAAMDGVTVPTTVRLAAGRYEITRMLRLRDGVTLVGAGPDTTVLALAPGVSKHLMTNADGRGGGRGIHLRSLGLLGRYHEQPVPEGHERYPFSCGLFLRNVTDVTVTDVVAREIRSTAFHFDGCRHVRLTDIETHGVGWSGVSTSGTDDIEVWRLVATDSGRDVKHSAVHLDGGVGAYVEATVSDATGTGIMLEALHTTLEEVVVRASATRCSIGLSASAGEGNVLRHVVATGSFSRNRDAGVMVANAERVHVVAAEIRDNGSHGVRFQGARGGRLCLVADCTISGNPVAVEERDASGDNLVVGSSHQRPPTAGDRARAGLERAARRARRAAERAVREVRPGSG